MIGKIRMLTCVCLYICIDMYIHTCICIIKIKTKDLCVYMCIHLSTYIFILIHIYIILATWDKPKCVSIYIHTYVHLSTDITYIMFTHKHFHTYISTYIHTLYIVNTLLVIKVHSMPNITDFLMVSLKTACLTNRACAKMLMHIFIATFVHTYIFSIYIHMFIHTCVYTYIPVYRPCLATKSKKGIVPFQLHTYICICVCS